MAHCGLDNWNFSYSFFYEKLKISKLYWETDSLPTDDELSVNISQSVPHELLAYRKMSFIFQIYFVRNNNY